MSPGIAKHPLEGLNFPLPGSEPLIYVAPSQAMLIRKKSSALPPKGWAVRQNVSAGKAAETKKQLIHGTDKGPEAQRSHTIISIYPKQRFQYHVPKHLPQNTSFLSCSSKNASVVQEVEETIHT